ncbi:hypothetical protein RSOLAG1IB_03878 [Rhizoctonia solani AG-1 IB]|uniref:Uncharacterized protein n=1 Tax=Thanatephorus cucumeris (strain AG1-IB / isolate 7/3/14) TaxID=1108050 RepID=A0A0B7FSJ7_THACB|nr:hypothetical protein RSOLAG1IB_03878 [Rhizoctonia solani AG-1 IB]
MIIKSSIGQYGRHVHFPVVDSLTCRRPIPSSVSQLVSQATSICISARNESFFYTAHTALSSLLHSTKNLISLEFYCEPITYGFDTLALIGANLIPACPRSLKTLCITLPGGQPDYTGPEKLLGALSSPPPDLNHPISDYKLEFIHLSVHVSPQVASRPTQLALNLAQRLPDLRHVALVAPRRNVQRKVSLFELIGPREESRNEQESSHHNEHWRVLREPCVDAACIESQTPNGIRLEALP